MLFDLNDPRKVIARSRNFINEPETYCERFGLYIPSVLLPGGAIVKDGLLYLYYGVCDTAIALATVLLDELVRCVLNESGRDSGTG